MLSNLSSISINSSNLPGYGQRRTRKRRLNSMDLDLITEEVKVRGNFSKLVFKKDGMQIVSLEPNKNAILEKLEQRLSQKRKPKVDSRTRDLRALEEAISSEFVRDL